MPRSPLGRQPVPAPALAGGAVTASPLIHTPRLDGPPIHRLARHAAEKRPLERGWFIEKFARRAARRALTADIVGTILVGLVCWIWLLGPGAGVQHCADPLADASARVDVGQLERVHYLIQIRLVGGIYGGLVGRLKSVAGA
jgi:hypothetical protein